MLLFLLMLFPASAEGWYYPDETALQVPLDPRLELTRGVLIGLEEPGAMPDHPAVVQARWLSEHRGIARLELRDPADSLRVSQELHQRSEVAWSHPDFRVLLTLHTLPDDPYYPGQWHLENDGQAGSPGVDIDAETAWALSTGAGQIIAVIDSGVDVEHPDLDAIAGYDYVDQDEDPYPEDGEAHGTACAGLAGGVGDNQLGIAGVAYDAQIYGIRLLGGWTTLGDVYKSTTEAVDAGASVISNSWGYDGGCEGYTLPNSIRNGFIYAEEEGRGGLGTVVVQAAGNDNCDISGDGLLAYETVVAVGAISSLDERESYSSYGEPLDIVAPSGGLLTTDITGEPGYGNYQGDQDYTDQMSGTSAATPVVAGVFGLMFAANDRLSAATAREVLCQTATRNDILHAEFDASGWSPYYGCGRVDAGAAVAAVANSAPGAPSPAMPTDTVYEDRSWLDWSPAQDPDGDRLSYLVQWWTTGEVVEELVDGTSLELTGQVSAGDQISWQVQAIDLWGAGDWSDTTVLTVIARPEPAPAAPAPSTEEGGCQAVIGGAGWLGWLGLLGLVGRRQARPSPEDSLG